MGTVRITCTSAPCTSPAEDVFGEKWCLLESLKTVSCFHSMSMYRVSLSSSVSSEGREPASKIRKKKNAVLKKTMSEQYGGWKKKRDWREKSKPQWHVSAVEDTAQSSRTDGCNPKTQASGEKSLQKYMNGPHHFKRNSHMEMKAVQTVPKEKETHSSWPRWRPTTRSKKMKRGTTSTSSLNNCAKKEKRKMKLVLFWKKCRKIWRRPRQKPLQRN